MTDEVDGSGYAKGGFDAADYSWESRGVFSSAYKAMLDGAAMFPPIIYDDRPLTRWEWIKVKVFRKPDPRHRWPDTMKVALNTNVADHYSGKPVGTFTLDWGTDFTESDDDGNLRAVGPEELAARMSGCVTTTVYDGEGNVVSVTTHTPAGDNGIAGRFTVLYDHEQEETS